MVDLNKADLPEVLRTDVCIVGSGPAGITLATELDGTQATVLILEAGGPRVDADVQEVYALENTGHPIRQNFMSRARYYGGTSNIWPGRSMVLSELDFQPRPWVPHSGWPLPYQEVAGYYPRAAEILRLPPSESFQADAWRRPNNAALNTFFESERLLPNVALWGKRPRRFGPAYRRQLSASKNVTVSLHSHVLELELSADGNTIQQVHVVRQDGRRFRVRSRLVVLACGGIENARLLLISNSRGDTGIGNQHDLVGRFYMDHPRAVHGHVRLTADVDLTTLLGLPVPGGKMQLGLAVAPELQRQEQLLNNYLSLHTAYSDGTQEAYHSMVQVGKRVLRRGYAGQRLPHNAPRATRIPDLIYHATPMEILPHALYRAYSTFQKRRKRDLVVVNYCEQAPDPESRVSLGTKRDRFDKPLLVLDWRVGAAEKRTLQRLQDFLREHLEQASLGRLETDDADVRFTDASHHIGTTRMSASPKDGVVDSDCRVHGIANLYIAGSSVFPTGGHANPTLTIVALALRLAAHLRKTLG